MHPDDEAGRFGVPPGPAGRLRRQVIVGRFPQEEVEASLSNGETVRDEAGDQAFAIFAPDGVEVCRLRLLGADGQELGLDSFVPDEPGNPCHAP